MDSTLRDPARSAHLPTPDVMAKADLRKAELRDWRVAVGGVLHRAMILRGWSLKEFAAAVDRDERQCARWMDGTERPQFDTVFAVVTLRQPVLQAWGELAGAEVQTIITMRRVA